MKALAKYRAMADREVLPPWSHDWLLGLLSLVSSLALYLYFADRLDIIVRYWDGPNYLYIAKTLYQIPPNHPFVPYNTTPAYFACHLPLYPLLIRLLTTLFNYPVAMLLTTLATSAGATVLFYRFLREFKLVENPLWAAMISIFFPIRWLIYHSVGATEPLFLCLVLASFYCYYKEKYWLAFALAALASLTRIVGLMLFPTYILVLLLERRWRWLPATLLIPAGVLALFTFYHFRFGDFWAYFRWNSALIRWPVFMVFRAYTATAPPHGAELYFGLYTLYGLGTLLLFRHRLLFVYCLMFCLFNLFVFHEDLSRYFLPISYFALIVAFDRFLNTRAFRLVFVALVVPLSFWYSCGVLSQERYLVVPDVYFRLLQEVGYLPAQR